MPLPITPDSFLFPVCQMAIHAFWTSPRVRKSVCPVIYGLCEICFGFINGFCDFLNATFRNDFFSANFYILIQTYRVFIPRLTCTAMPNFYRAPPAKLAMTATIALLSSCVKSCFFGICHALFRWVYSAADG